MNHYGGKELAASFRTVRKNTMQIAEDIPEDKYSYRATPESRSVAELLAHIAISTKLQEEIHAKLKLNTLAGFNFPAFFQTMAAEEKIHRNKAEVMELLRSNGDTWARWLESLSDDFLAQSVAMPPGGSPPARSRFEMFLGVKEHEMHHRGQLMLIERLLGVVPHLTRARQAQRAAAESKR